MIKNRIKEFLAGFGVIAFLFGCVAFADTYQTYYIQYAEVYICDTDETLLIDSTGNLWSVDSTNELNEGDYVKLKFYNNHTDYTREDDEIVNIKRVD